MKFNLPTRQISIFYLLALSLLAWLIPLMTSHWSTTNLEIVTAAPTIHHWFGTDSLGRDLLARTIVGGQISLFICVIASIVSLVLGITLGGMIAMSPVAVETVLIRFLEVLISLPYLIYISLTSLFLESIFPGSGIINILGALIISSWMSSARYIRNLVKEESKKDYVESARALGNSRWRILWIHILPNLRSKILVYWGLQIPQAIMAEGILSFIGLGVKSPLVSWGQLLQEGWRMAAHYPHMLWGPAIIFTLTILSFNLILDSYRKDFRVDNSLRESHL